jgi:hypothetical protein
MDQQIYLDDDDVDSSNSDDDVLDDDNIADALGQPPRDIVEAYWAYRAAKKTFRTARHGKGKGKGFKKRKHFQRRPGGFGSGKGGAYF